MGIFCLVPIATIRKLRPREWCHMPDTHSNLVAKPETALDFSLIPWPVRYMWYNYKCHDLFFKNKNIYWMYNKENLYNPCLFLDSVCPLHFSGRRFSTCVGCSIFWGWDTCGLTGSMGSSAVFLINACTTPYTQTHICTCAHTHTHVYIYTAYTKPISERPQVSRRRTEGFDPWPTLFNTVATGGNTRGYLKL